MSVAYKVGELCLRTGLSVRTLRFYDEIGLLKPSDRTDSGHRLYSEADVARLQRIVSLRTLGLTLEEIGDLLDGREGEPALVLRRHAASLREQVVRARLLAERLEYLADRIEQSEAEVEDLLTAIGEIVMYERYYTQEQLAQLEKRRQELGDEGMARAQQEWAELIEKARQAKDQGLPIEDPQVQALARRWKGLIDAFTGGDPGIRQSLDRLWRENGQAMAQRSGIDEELGRYMGQAMAALG